jgi:predicted AAA+ superfamily ATPase
MLIFETRKFAESSYKRLRNPAKIYLIDTGICRKVASADWGRMLENIVFSQLRRKSKEIFYFEEKKECDFIIKDEQGKLFSCQVTWELKEENKEREIKGVVGACKKLNVKEGVLFTYDKEGSEIAEGINIKIMPVWKWLLRPSH